MKASTLNTPSQRKVDPNRLADFVMMTQRSCILNLSSELNRGNISFPQFFLLTYLSSEDYLTMSAIAKKMGHSTAAATGLVDRLEKLGFVERVHAAEDRRKIMVRITSSGSEIVSTMRQHIDSVLNFDRSTGSTSIDLYDYITFSKVKVIATSKTNVREGNFANLKRFLYAFGRAGSVFLFVSDYSIKESLCRFHRAHSRGPNLY